MTFDRISMLVVDDHENMRALLRDMFGARYEIALAADGGAAAALIATKAFDVVLTDVRMPGPDGMALVSLIKERHPLTEVIVMTAFASIPAAVEAMRQGAYDYIQKPFDLDEVTLLVARALGRRRERTGLTPPLGYPIFDLGEDLADLSYRQALASARERDSREYLAALLRKFGGNVSKAAERAGLERESLHRLLRRHGIRAEVFRDQPSRGGNDSVNDPRVARPSRAITPTPD